MRYVLYAGTVLPLAAMTALYSYVLRVRAALGYWPEPAYPDPKALGFFFQYMG